ncbi:hypothetical protein F2P79_003473 [Pimephales promelas]|nr:hypothetical protein F2P79_003473 [Pimephales promelas]
MSVHVLEDFHSGKPASFTHVLGRCTSFGHAETNVTSNGSLKVRLISFSSLLPVRVCARGSISIASVGGARSGDVPLKCETSDDLNTLMLKIEVSVNQLVFR